MLHWIRTRSRRDLILSVLIAGGFFVGVTAFLTRGIHVADGARYETKYPDEIADWRDEMRNGFRDGSRILIRYVR